MTLLETAEIMKTITKSYPNGNKLDDEQTVQVWFAMFTEDPANLVKMAVIKHISSNKWAPSVAEIREIMTEITRPDLIPTDEAWGMVTKWIHNTSEYGDDSAQVFPAMIAETIESCGGKSGLWALYRQGYNGYSPKAGLDKLTFTQLYEPRYQRERQNAMLPRQVYDSIRQVQAHLDNAEYDKLTNGKRYIDEKKQERDESYRRREQFNQARLEQRVGGDDDE